MEIKNHQILVGLESSIEWEALRQIWGNLMQGGN